MLSLGLAAATAVAGALLGLATVRAGRLFSVGVLISAPALSILGIGTLATLALAASGGAYAYRRYVAAQRRRAERDALADHLSAVVAHLRGGKALVEALAASSCGWIRSAAAVHHPESRIGALLREAALAQGLPAEDLAWSYALDDLIARDIPPGRFLAAVAERLAARRQARDRLLSATTQVRGQATILALLPPALLVLLILLDPVIMRRSLMTMPGLISLGSVLVLEWAAWQLIRRLLGRAP